MSRYIAIEVVGDGQDQFPNGPYIINTDQISMMQAVSGDRMAIMLGGRDRVIIVNPQTARPIEHMQIGHVIV